MVKQKLVSETLEVLGKMMNRQELKDFKESRKFFFSLANRYVGNVEINRLALETADLLTGKIGGAAGKVKFSGAWDEIVNSRKEFYEENTA